MQHVRSRCPGSGVCTYIRHRLTAWAMTVLFCFLFRLHRLQAGGALFLRTAMTMPPCTHHCLPSAGQHASTCRPTHASNHRLRAIPLRFPSFYYAFYRHSSLSRIRISTAFQFIPHSAPVHLLLLTPARARTSRKHYW